VIACFVGGLRTSTSSAVPAPTCPIHGSSRNRRMRAPPPRRATLPRPRRRGGCRGRPER
jgi:hypothetical protein